MDPVTTFGLAVGVLQVVGVSLKAVSVCREMHTKGSLAENRLVGEVTESLGQWNHLQQYLLLLASLFRAVNKPPDVVNLVVPFGTAVERTLVKTLSIPAGSRVSEGYERVGKSGRELTSERPGAPISDQI